jgi:hypothetical protein
MMTKDQKKNTLPVVKSGVKAGSFLKAVNQ